MASVSVGKGVFLGSTLLVGITVDGAGKGAAVDETGKGAGVEEGWNRMWMGHSLEHQYRSEDRYKFFWRVSACRPVKKH